MTIENELKKFNKEIDKDQAFVDPVEPEIEPEIEPAKDLEKEPAKKRKTIKMYMADSIKLPLKKAIDLNLPALLVGETGTGKTSFIRELARSSNKELIRINLTGETGIDDLIGKYLANDKGIFWQDGLLTRALKNGCWIVLDEINMALPEILSKLHSLLDDDRKLILNEKDGETIKPDPAFRLFATMNPCDEYAGTKELNKAFISRFPIVLSINFSRSELNILKNRSNISDDIAKNLILLAKEIRLNKEKQTITYTCSTRDLLACCDLIISGLPLDMAIEVAIINKASQDERPALRQLVKLIFGNKIEISNELSYTSINELIEKAKDFANIIKEYQEQNNKDKNQLNNFRAEITKLSNEILELKEQKEKAELKAKKLKELIDIKNEN